MPYHIGESRMRNTLLENVKTKYFMLCSDRLSFRLGTEQATSGIEQLMWVLDTNPRLDMVAGSWDSSAESGELIHGVLEAESVGRILYVKSRSLNDVEGWEGHCQYTHLFGSGWFLARTDRIRHTLRGWDEELPVGEDLDLFIRLRLTNNFIAFCPSVHAYRRKHAQEEALREEERQKQLLHGKHLLQKYNLRSLVLHNGAIFAQNDQIDPSKSPLSFPTEIQNLEV